MDCHSENCIAKRSEDKNLGIACPICLNCFHGKCVGLTGKVIETIHDATKGLRWTCPKCKSIDANLSSIFNHVRQGFTELKKDIAAVITKLHDYDKYFHEFDDLKKSLINKSSVMNLNLEHFMSCPNTPLFQSSDDNPNILINAADGLNLPSVSHDVNAGNIHVLTQQTSSTQPALRSLPSSSTNTHATTFQERQEPLAGNANVSAATTIAGNLDSAVNVTAVPNAAVSGSSQGNIQHSSNGIELGVVMPNKVIFISRLTPSTTIDDIAKYIHERLPQLTFSLYKYDFSYERSVASFKISVPESAFDTLLQRDFWPRGLVVREFQIKPRRNMQAIDLANPNNDRSKNYQRFTFRPARD